MKIKNYYVGNDLPVIFTFDCITREIIIYVKVKWCRISYPRNSIVYITPTGKLLASFCEYFSKKEIMKYIKSLLHPRQEHFTWTSIIYDSIPYIIRTSTAYDRR